MDVPSYLVALERQGSLLVDTAVGVEPLTPIPTCPGWTLRDLILHLGGIHRWAGSHVRESSSSILKTDLADIFDRLPDDVGLLEWYRGELDFLLQSLRTAPADLECATFLKCVDPLHHWARRQAHETCIHRADVESIGGRLTPVDTEFALDGIDELIDGFAARPYMKLRSAPPVTLGIAPDGAEVVWTLHISTEPVRVSRELDASDCMMSGNASDIYYVLWNRMPRERIIVTGESAVLDLFLDRIRIRWG